MGVVLRGSGGTFVVGTAELVFVRRGRTRRVPYAAITGCERDGRRVSVVAGLERFEVVGRTGDAVDAFVTALDAARRRPSLAGRRLPVVRSAAVLIGAAFLLLVWILLGPLVVLGLLISALASWCARQVWRGTWKHFLADWWHLRRRGVTVDGEITGYRDSRADHTKYPKLLFTTETGRRVAVESPHFVVLRIPEGPAAITYDPENPHNARAGGILPVVIGALGAALSVALLVVPAGFLWIVVSAWFSAGR
ncbi:hypothetical protein GCM10023148_05090 [Actinokineospora soli]